MDVLNGRIRGPFVVRDTLELGGHIVSGATVSPGATFFMCGLVGGYMKVQKGARAVIRGIVAGDLDIEEGADVEIYGVVTGKISDRSGCCRRGSETA